MRASVIRDGTRSPVRAREASSRSSPDTLLEAAGPKSADWFRSRFFGDTSSSEAGMTSKPCHDTNGPMQKLRKVPLVLMVVASLVGCKRSSPGSPDDNTVRSAPSRVASDANDPEPGCEKGDAHACFEAGVKYDSPEKGMPDLGRAADYYRKACDLGNPTACDNLGLMHFEGDAVPQNAELAFTLYSKACETGYPTACFHVARAHETGSGTPASANKAAQLYETVCATDPTARTGNPAVEKAVATACFNLGAMKLREPGGPADIREGRRLVELGCMRGIADSCTAWGVALAQGSLSEPKDAKRAAGLFQQGCDLGSLVGCYNLALAYRDGEGIPRNKLRAEEILSKACSVGSDVACDEVRRGTHTSKQTNK